MLRSIDPLSQIEIAFAGSVLKTGECTAMVVGTAERTKFGETVNLVTKSHPSSHALIIMKQVTVVACIPLLVLIISAIIFMSAQGNTDELKTQIPLLLLLLVSGFPVALPAMYTITQALASRALVSAGILVSRLNATEDAASMTLLFTDKTGTLTENKLTVSGVWSVADNITAMQTSQMDSQDAVGSANVSDDERRSRVATLNAPMLDVIGMAARASKKENADPIDSAILLHSQAINPSTKATDAAPVTVLPASSEGDEIFHIEEEVLHFAPFDATTRRTEAVILRSVFNTSSGKLMSKSLYRTCKGAPNTLMSLAQIGEGIAGRCREAIAAYANHAYRSIGVCASNQLMLPTSLSIEQVRGNLSQYLPHLQWSFIGVIALFDPPRQDSHRIIDQLRSHGIRTIMLTGDALAVAKEVAAQVGLGTDVHVLTEADRAYFKEQIKQHHSNRKPIRVSDNVEKNGRGTRISKDSLVPEACHGDANSTKLKRFLDKLPPVLFHGGPRSDSPDCAVIQPVVPSGKQEDNEEPSVSHVCFHMEQTASIPPHTKPATSTAPLTDLPVTPLTVSATVPLKLSTSAAESVEIHISSENAPTNATITKSPAFDMNSISGLAELFPSDKHMLIQFMQAQGFVVGMTGDGVNDAPSLKQAEVGCAMSNATDAAKGSASIIFLRPGLGGILPVIHSGRQIHRRIVSWVLNKIAKTVTNACFIIIAFFLFSRYPVTSIELAIILLLVDFTTLCLATDTVHGPSIPCKWRVFRLAKVAIGLAVLNATVILLIYFFAQRWWNVTVDELSTLGMMLMYYMGNFTTLIVREDRHWWSSWPSGSLAVTVAMEQVVLACICLLGINLLNVAQIPAQWFFITWGVLLLWTATVSDVIKLALHKWTLPTNTLSVSEPTAKDAIPTSVEICLEQRLQPSNR